MIFLRRSYLILIVSSRLDYVPPSLALALLCRRGSVRFLTLRFGLRLAEESVGPGDGVPAVDEFAHGGVNSLARFRIGFSAHDGGHHFRAVAVDPSLQIALESSLPERGDEGLVFDFQRHAAKRARGE